MNKNEINNVIKEYVNENYPQRVTNYNGELSKQKQMKIEAVQSITFIQDNLMWQDEKSNISLKLNRLETKLYCKKLNHANRKDWRVPTYKEMISLVDYMNVTPASILKLEHIIPLEYWTSSKSVLEENKNWFVNFDYGLTGTSSKFTRYNIRCVRDMSTIEGTY